MKRTFSLYILCFLHLLIGVSATAGGALLMLAPDGSLLGMQPGWLDESPFQNYFLPGVILFLLNGIFPIFTFIGLVLKPSWKFANAINIFPEMHWAWTYSLYAGITLIMWIAFQLIMTEYFWLQPVIILLGLLIIVFTMLPVIIKFFELKNKTFIA